MEGQTKKRDPGALSRAMAKTATDNMASAGRGMPRRRVTITIPAAECAPGLFDEDFELTLESLTSKVELDAARRSRGDSTSIAFWFAYYSMAAVNGVPLNDAEGEREWLWEALGPARQIVLGAYAKGCVADADSQGKALQTIRVE